MKKKLFLITLVISLNIESYSQTFITQHTYIDALRLAKIKHSYDTAKGTAKNGYRTAFLNILKNYNTNFDDTQNDTTLNTINIFFNKYLPTRMITESSTFKIFNSLLEKNQRIGKDSMVSLFNKVIVNKTDNLYSLNTDALEINNALNNAINIQQIMKTMSSDNARTIVPQSSGINPSSASSPDWQSTVLSGVSSFMAKRAKEEVVHFAIDQLFQLLIPKDYTTDLGKLFTTWNNEHDAAKKATDKKAITDFINKYPITSLVKTLFPKTVSYIDQIVSTGNYYASDFNTISLLLIKDFQNSPEVLIDSNIIKGLSPVEKDIILTSYQVLLLNSQKYSLPNILTKISQPTAPFNDPTVKNIFLTANLLSQALLDTAGSGNAWVDLNKLSPLYLDNTNRPEVRYFYGLLYEQLKSSGYSHYLNGHASIDDVANVLNQAIEFIDKMNLTYDDLKAKKFKLSNVTDLLNLVDETKGNIEYFLNDSLVKSKINLTNEMSEADQFLLIAEDVSKGNYQLVIPAVLVEFGNKIDPKYSNIARTLSILGQFASVDSASQVENLLESYALPIGSSSVKRYSNFNLSLNGYVGFNGGHEWTIESQSNKTVLNDLGLTAPIGISVTEGGHFTEFISILDLGSIVNTRLTDTNSTFSGLKFEQFFAPGLSIFYNIKSAPITFGLQSYYIPGLEDDSYEVNNVKVTKNNVDAFRLNITILIDIPFFTLYNDAPH